MRRIRFEEAACAALCGLFLGCSGRPYGVAPVTGTIWLDDEPLAGGVVNFQPIASQGTSPGPGSSARIGSDGRYQLMMLDGSPGAVVATHRVRIYSLIAEGRPVSDTEESGAPRERVPEQYNYRTNLTYTVPEAGAAEADFRLVTRPP